MLSLPRGRKRRKAQCSWALLVAAMGAGRDAEEEAAMQDPTIGPNSRLAEFRNKVGAKEQDRKNGTVTFAVLDGATEPAHKDRFSHH